MGSKPQNNIANLRFADDVDAKEDKIGKTTNAKSEDKMDVTALMDLLDKNRKNQTTEAIAANKVAEKPTFDQISSNITNSGIHTPDNANDPIFTQHPLRHTLIILVILTTILGFFGMLYVVDNKADDWFIKASNKQNNADKLGTITPAAGTSKIEERIQNDRNLAENPVTKNTNPQRKEPTFAPVDDQELLRLLSNPAPDQ